MSRILSPLQSLQPLRRIALLAVLVALPLLQGCVPIVVAGAATGVTASLDRRSYGVQLEDSEIEVKGTSEIKSKFGARASSSVTSFNRWVLLTGRVDSEETRTGIEQAIRGIPNVRNVVNDLVVVTPPVNSSMQKYSNDTAITTLVKGRLIDSKDVAANNIKVVTESNVVYLMGLVTQKEADTAIEVARNTRAVSKVVHAFEIITPEQAKQLDPPPPKPDASGTDGSRRDGGGTM